MKNDKNGKLIDAVGGIGEDLVKEAEAYDGARRRTGMIVRIASVAAVFVLAAVLLPLLFTMPRENGTVQPGKDLTPVLNPVSTGNDVEDRTSGSRAALPEELRGVSVRASESKGKIISTSEHFIIETEKSCETGTITEYLNLSPKTNYSITKLSGNSFEVVPEAESLYPGTVYRLSFGNPDNPAASYSFQTDSELIVKSMLPADMSEDVPVNTGIEIVFSEKLGDVDLGSLVSIEPAAECDYMLYPDGRTVAVIPKKQLEYATVYTVTVSDSAVSSTGKKLAESRTARFYTELSEKAALDYPFYVNIEKTNGRDSVNWNYYYYGSDEMIFSSDEDLVIAFSSWSSVAPNGTKKAAAELYRFRSAEDALKAVKNSVSSAAGSVEASYSTQGLSFIGKFDPSFTDDEDFGGYFSFGTGFEKGVYLAKMTFSASLRYADEVSTVTKFVLVQVTDLRAFTLSSDGKTLLRVDRISGGSCEGASVEAENFVRSNPWNGAEGKVTFTPSGSVISDGYCVLETGDGDSSIVTVRDGGDLLILCVTCAPVTDDGYVMSYIYTDRETYFQNDKVSFAGFTVPVIGELPDRLYLKTSGSSSLQELEIGENGSFSGSYVIENHSEGGEFMAVVDRDGRVYASKYIRITEQEKPKITASISFDKLFYEYGDKVTVTIHASFFDGTPAEGFRFTFYSEPFSAGYSDGVTDKNGDIVFSFATGNCRVWSTDPVSIWVYAELTGLETQTLTVRESVYYFHSEYVFGTIWESGRRALTLNRRDTSVLRTEDDLRYGVFPANTVGGPADGQVSYVLKKEVISKIEKTAYDKYTKRSYTYYDYVRNEYTEKSGTMTFTDGVIELPLYEVTDFNGGYYYEISFYDGRNTFETTVWANRNGYRGSRGSRNTELVFDKEKYKVGEKITASLNIEGSKTGNTLFAVFADGLVQYCKGAEITVPFEGYTAVGGSVYAVAFDGVSGEYVFRNKMPALDTSGNAIDLEIGTDREKYAPGDTVTVTVRAKDAPGAAVIISVADEACFALGEQKEDTLNSFFSSLSKLGGGYRYYGYSLFDEYDYGWYYPYYGYGLRPIKSVIVNGRFSSSEDILGSDQSDGNGGGIRKGASTGNYDAVADAPDATEAENNNSGSESGTRIRETFLDNPVFVTGRLGADGEAVFVFTAPDNITSWRITAAAADLSPASFADARFGNAVSEVVCTLDFFISLSAPSYYIEGDDASLLARSFGILSGGQVSYSATLKDDSGNVISTASAEDDSKGYAQLNFGKLGAGHYSVTVYGSSSSASDALVTEFDVVRSAHIMRTYSAVALGEIGKISPALFPVTITFMEESTQQRLLENIISVLRYGNGSDRSDMLAAKYAALAVSSRMFGTDESEEIDSVRRQFRDYLQPLVSLLRYSEGDVELTANILSFAPDLFDSSSKSQLVMELREMLEAEYQSDAVALCATLSALASLDEPVLDILYSIADFAGDYPAEAKLHLACAFASLGDWTAASAVYGHVRDEIAVTDPEYGTMRFGETEGSDTARLTSLALAAASRCCRSDALMLAKYLCENISLTDVSTCGLAAFARYYLPDAVFGEKKLTVRINGEEKEMTVSPTLFESVTLSKSEFESFEIVSAEDGIIAGVNYYAPAADVLGERTLSDRVKIDKRIEPYGNGLYRVTLTVYGTSTRVNECFDISDIVPSGARFFSLYNDSDSYWRDGNVHTSAWLWNSAGQRVSGGVYIYNSIYANLIWEEGNYVWKTDCPEYSFSVSVSYVIRAAVTGEFIAESAAVRNLATDIYSVSERNIITISENGWVIKPAADTATDIAIKK